MEPFQICVKNIPIDQDGAFHTIYGTCLSGEFQQPLVAEAIDDFSVLVAEIQAAQPLCTLSDVISLL